VETTATETEKTSADTENTDVADETHAREESIEGEGKSSSG